MVLAVLVLGLIWLNGPGLRLFAPRVAQHYLEDLGIRGDFKIEGNLVGGLSFSDLRIESDSALASLTIDRVIPDYEWRGLMKGQLKGLTLDGVHAELLLGLKPENPDKPPLDLKKLVETLRTARSRVIPLELELKNFSLAATRDGKLLLQLESSSLTHRRGSADLTLNLGAITDAAGREWPARQSTITWGSESLSVPRVDPFPGISVRDLAVQLPAGGEPSLEAQLALDDAAFVITSSPGFTSAKIDLREGKLQLGETAKRFGLEIPAAAELTSLAIEVEQILPDPKAATGTVKLLLENLAWRDWAAPELSMDATLGSDEASIVARGMMLGTGFTLDAAAPVTRDEKTFSLGDAQGRFSIDDVPRALRELSTRFPAIDPDAPVPPSAVDGKFNVTFAANQPQAATVELNLKAKDVTLASPIALKASWTSGQPLAADLTLDGLTATATYQPIPATYQGSVNFEDFTNARIDRWLAILKVKPGGTASLTGKWTGGGELKTGKHRGELTLDQGTWSRESVAPVTAIGTVRYDWPAGFETQGLRLQMNDQTVALEAALADGMLELRRFLWSAGKDELAEGSASLPVPADFSKWRDTLANDTRPIAVSIQSRVLPLGLLKDWAPALEKLDPRSTGQLQLNVAGTYAVPSIDAKLEARELRSPGQPQLPAADLKITLAGRDGRLTINGSATAPDFPPAVMKATMPFLPSEWAKDPAKFKEEPISARLDLPRLDLARFTTLVPAASQVSGIVTGNVVVAGKIGKPDLKGSLNLTGGGIRLKDPRIPAIEGIAATVDLGLDRIVLKSLKSNVAGGSLSGEGSLVIADGKLGNLDLRVRGDHLPVMRNELFILRANADLRLSGTWAKADLTGTVGLVDSIFFRDIELLPIGKPFTGPAAAALPKFDPPKRQSALVPEPFRNWGLNVTVRTAEPFLIRGNLANGDVTGTVRVGGTVGSPAPDGVVTIKDFRASLPFSTLSVGTGTATFTPATGFDPFLEIRGTAEPRPYRVSVYVYGRASDRQLVLTSNPPLPENEIMTLLATGTTTSGLEDPQAASSRALQLLVEELRRGRFRFGKQLRPVLAMLDRVDFSLSEADPYTSDSYSTATLAISDRWFLSAGVGSTGDSRVLAIWRLSFR